MPFTHTVDGDYTNPVLLSRVPVDSGIPKFKHFFWEETLIQHHDNYHPRVIGGFHPDGYDDPVDPLSDTGTNIYDLAAGGSGNGPLYLTDEKIIQRVGPLVVFRREYSALPIRWTEREFGFHTFPGRKAVKEDTDGNNYLIVVTHPKTLPCLIESQYSYSAGAPISIVPWDIPTYYTGGGGYDGANAVDYVGWGLDENGNPVNISQRGGGTRTRPVISAEVTRWRGEIFQIKVRKVVDTLR